jgi:hypothetical protein
MHHISYRGVASLLYIIPEHPEAFDQSLAQFKNFHHSRNLDLVFTKANKKNKHFLNDYLGAQR